MWAGSPIVPASTPTVGAAVATHSHAAGDITSGTVDVARLPVGTGSTQVAAGNHTHTAAAVGAVAAAGTAVALWLGTESEYAAIVSPSATTVYVVTEDP